MMGFAALTSRHSKPSLPLVLAACIGVTLFRMDIKKATKAYEAWLGGRIPLIDADLRLKHQRMAQSPFPFLRATFYRWVQLWPQICPELVNAPGVLGVGDLHVENFGTWRDGEGRLIWGVND